MAMTESAYVAIGIACVVATLLIVVLIVYCVKHQHDKEDARRRQEELHRRERHRRHLMRTTVVRPPPYDSRRGHGTIPRYDHQPIPVSPPPEYKERATPYPQQTIGIGGMMHPPPGYEPIPTVAMNVPPANTVYNNEGYINYLQSSQPVTNNNSYNMMNHRPHGAPQLITRPVGNRSGDQVTSSIIVVNPSGNTAMAPSRPAGNGQGQQNGSGRVSRLVRETGTVQPNVSNNDRETIATRNLVSDHTDRANRPQDVRNTNQIQDPFRQAVHRTQYYEPSVQSSTVTRGQNPSYAGSNAANSRMVEDLSLI